MAEVPDDATRLRQIDEAVAGIIRAIREEDPEIRNVKLDTAELWLTGACPDPSKQWRRIEHD